MRVRERAIESIGELIYAVRWGLVPMYLGLWLAVIWYDVRFFYELVGFLLEHHHTGTDFLIWILSLIDITMIANLVVMTTIGGYSTFVKEYQLNALEGRPRWMNGLDSSALKIKMGMSLMGVSAIDLLKTFMEAGTTNWDVVLKKVLIHVVFLVTTLAFTLNARLAPHKQPEVKVEDHH